ncbi:MAG: methyl-accepting chemotaxis protein, partial [Bacillota bacterium]|nr:methyl-accepting chemotaxis protein [Bacillota bacterium]
MRFAITSKLAANLLAVVLLLTGTGIFISRQIADVHQQAVALREKARIFEAAANLRLALTNMAMPPNDYLITGNPEERLNFARASEKALRIAGLLRQMPLSQEQRAVLEQIVAGHQEIVQRGEGVLAISDPVGNAAAGQAMEELDAAADALARRTQELYALLHREMEAALLKADRSGTQAINLFLGASFLLFLSFLVIFWLINASIVNPMRRFIAAAQTVAGGDLSHNIAIRSGDGFAELGEAFNHMTANLRGLVAQVHQVAEQVTALSQELASSSDEMSQLTQQVNSTVEQLAQGADEQAHHAAQTGQAVEEVSQTMNRVAQEIQGAGVDSRQVWLVATEGGGAVQQAVEQMNSIHQAVARLAEVVDTLGRRSAAVGRIVETIAGIADQTNLLALNAAIEAARAGEQGRGFAVVAEEVRKLAEHAARSAEEIGRLLQEIQRETQQAVSAMAQATQEVQGGIKVMAATGQAFATIVAAVERLSKRMEGVAQAAADVTRQASDASQAVQNIAAITQENAAAAQEVAASTQAHEAA